MDQTQTPIRQTAQSASEKMGFWSRFVGFFRATRIFFRETLFRVFGFVFLILVYILTKMLFRIWNLKQLFHRTTADETASFTPTEILFSRFAGKLLSRFKISTGVSIDKISLIEIALRNMKVKKTRTIITVGGMAVGIASIVFLVSLGYGLERLVTSRVAKLEEMQQADVSPQAGSRIKITDKTIADFTALPDVDAVLPQISVVGRVNYQNSVSDMAAYGVTSQYLIRSAIQPVSGRFFESDTITAPPELENASEDTSALQVSAQRGTVISDVAFSSEGVNWVRLRKDPDPDAEFLGYVRVSSDEQIGLEVWGSTYLSAHDEAGHAAVSPSGEKLGQWIEGEYPVYSEEKCSETNPDCVLGTYLLKRTGEDQVVAKGYFTLSDDWLKTRLITTEEKDKLLEEKNGGLALNISASGDGWVQIGGLNDAADAEGKNIEKAALPKSALREAVVSRAMLRILNLQESEAIDKSISVSFVITGNLLDDTQRKVESIPADFKIVGVIPEDKTPIFYVAFSDLRSLGVKNYSQIKVAAENQALLPEVRNQIQSMGYATSSVADTVDQIKVFFARARLVLALLGMAALGVAALGMFNTLTVSLLERTREVGLMKAIGMKSHEVQELFLTESMVMAFFGGILGLTLGIALGKSIGIVLSLFAYFRGIGYIDVSFVPASFIIVILIFSLFVGIVTGIYPARRATNISALNALRYE